MEIVIIYPHQLFKHHPCIQDGRKILLIEHPHFFTRLNFHKQKLLLHRASMKRYEARLKDQGQQVEYIEFHEYKELKAGTYFACDPIEKDIQEELTKVQATIVESPNFVCSAKYLNDYFQNHAFFMASFYKAQRKRLNILVDKKGNPKGGKWSFDSQNRKKLPQDIEIPKPYKPREDDFLKEAYKYVEKHFKDNPGKIDSFMWPTSHAQAERSLQSFLDQKFKHFGDYQDAFEADQNFLFHSLLSSSINIGLLNPMEVVQAAIDYAKDHKVPMNALEGFVRQIIGWREYVRAVYLLRGKDMIRRNYWGFDKKMPVPFYDGSTGIPPVDDAIRHTLDFAYAHHIERLMVLGNFMLLSEIHPKEVLNWFTELYVDAYEWVMVPNVIGMSQYADGGSMVTKPYISSSNYIRKMSHYSKGDWADTWDALYWSFIDTHKKELKENPRFGMMMRVYANKSDKQLREYRKAATAFQSTFN